MNEELITKSSNEEPMNVLTLTIRLCETLRLREDGRGDSETVHCIYTKATALHSKTNTVSQGLNTTERPQQTKEQAGENDSSRAKTDQILSVSYTDLISSVLLNSEICNTPLNL